MTSAPEKNGTTRAPMRTRRRKTDSAFVTKRNGSTGSHDTKREPPQPSGGRSTRQFAQSLPLGPRFFVEPRPVLSCTPKPKQGYADDERCEMVPLCVR